MVDMNQMKKTYFDWLINYCLNFDQIVSEHCVLLCDHVLMMSASGGLTAEQKRKIEENRQKALAKRAEKLSKSPIKACYGFNDNTSSGNRPNIGNNNVVTHASKASNNN
jgi:hypothetical protein